VNISLLDAALFSAAFAVLFLAPGYALLRKKSYGAPELAARCFVVSSGIVLLEGLLLASTIGVTPLSLGIVAAATIILAYRSATP